MNTIKISKLSKEDSVNRSMVYEFVKDNYSHDFSEENYIFDIFVAILYPENILIGTIILKVYPDNVNKIHLCCLCIDSCSRNKGYGSNFLRFIKRYYSNKSITLSVLFNETNVLKFYMKNGAIQDTINTENNTITMILNNI
jgi:ribosomal protein S18 acetylase RimI-like enzyme